MIEETDSSSSLDNTLYFTSVKNASFDFSLPIKKNLSKFVSENRIEASPYLFEYLCFKLAKKKLEKIKNINSEISIISEKFLSSEISNKSESIRKKYVFVPIRNSISRKWNAVIFIHLEKQITQYMNQINEEPIIAKIISSNINSEEDDYILNTTMDRIESTFNFSSPEDIQFEVDSINISDQPNTSIFLLNFVEGLIEQKSDEDIMNYIMKLYDESSNTNVIGSNNYFISFNKENELFKDILQVYEKELEEYLKTKGDNDENEGAKLLKLEENEEEIDSEEEALKIIAKENDAIRKQMEEQEIVFNMKINDPNYRLENDDINYKNRNNFLGQIQEVDNESEDESERKSNFINKSLKLSKSLKKNENNVFNDEKIKKLVKEKLSDLNEFDNNNKSQNLNKIENNQNIKTVKNEVENFNKKETIDLIDNNKNIENEVYKNKEESGEMLLKNGDNKHLKEKNIIIEKGDNKNINIDNKADEIINKKEGNTNEDFGENNSKEIKEEKELLIKNNNNNEINIIKPNEKNDSKEIIKDEVMIIKESDNIFKNNKDRKESIDNQKDNETQKENISLNNLDKIENNSFEQINIPKFQNKTIEISNSDIHIKNSSLKDIHNSIRDSFTSNNTNNSIYEKKKVYQKRNSFTKTDNSDNTNDDFIMNKYNNTNFYISKGKLLDNKENNNENSIKVKTIESDIDKIENNINKDNIKENVKNNIIFNKKNGIGKYKTNLPLVKNNNKEVSKLNNKKINNNIYNERSIDYNKFEKKTIIINESSNNKTVINIIGIKNNYKTEDTKEQIMQKKKKYENKNDKNIINNQNQIWNINISNHNKINLINKETEENEYITKIPDDGTINRISSTLCANNTITGINNNQEKSYKTISYLNNKENKDILKTEPNETINKGNMVENLLQEELKDLNFDSKNYNITEEKLDIDNELNNRRSQIKIDDENNIDVNMMVSNTNKNRIQRLASKKRMKGNYSYGFFKEYEASDCGMDFTKDLKCGCNGGTDTGCNII